MKSVIAASGCLLFVALVATGCAGMRTVEVGATQEAVRAALGAPTVQAKTSADRTVVLDVALSVQAG